MNNKAQTEGDLAVFIIIIFFIILIGFIVVKVFGGVNTGLQNQNIGTVPAQASSDANTGFCNGFNSGVVVAIVFLYIGLFITSRYVGSNPMFLFINIFLLVIALGLAALFGNVFDAATNNPNFVTERACMPAAVFVGNRLLEFAIGAVAIILIGLFAKPGGQSEIE